MKLIANAVQKFDQATIAELEQKNVLDIEINGKSITLQLSDVEITSQDIEGWLVANANGLTVALDVTISDELRKEGIARELVNRIQNLRKDQDFEVVDKIEITFEEHPVIQEAVATNEAYIKAETLTNNICFNNALINGTEIEFDDIKTKISIKKI